VTRWAVKSAKATNPSFRASRISRLGKEGPGRRPQEETFSLVGRTGTVRGAADEGTSSAIAFALAGVLFIAALSTVLVYANDPIPPPAQSRPLEESSAEGRQLLQSLVLSGGNDTWSGTAWAKAAGKRPGLRDCDPSCTAPVALNVTKLQKLAQTQARCATGNTASACSWRPVTPSTTGSYSYEELRTALGMTATGRGFNVTVTKLDTEDPVLWYGEPSPERVAVQPAISYLTLDDAAKTEVRVTVSVFLVNLRPQ